jgi:hypothetical protein
MADVDPDVTALFLEFSRKKLLEQYWPRLRNCVESLTDEQVWWRPNAASNSIGNLILHLNGNVRQWLVASFNRLEDKRDRPAEFDAREGISASALLKQLGATIEGAAQVLERLTQADLVAAYEIHGYKVTGLYAVYHQESLRAGPWLPSRIEQDRPGFVKVGTVAVRPVSEENGDARGESPMRLATTAKLAGPLR